MDLERPRNESDRHTTRQEFKDTCDVRNVNRAYLNGSHFIVAAQTFRIFVSGIPWRTAFLILLVYNLHAWVPSKSTCNGKTVWTLFNFDWSHNTVTINNDNGKEESKLYDFNAVGNNIIIILLSCLLVASLVCFCLRGQQEPVQPPNHDSADGSSDGSAQLHVEAHDHFPTLAEDNGRNSVLCPSGSTSAPSAVTDGSAHLDSSQSLTDGHSETSLSGEASPKVNICKRRGKAFPISRSHKNERQRQDCQIKKSPILHLGVDNALVKGETVSSQAPAPLSGNAKETCPIDKSNVPTRVDQWDFGCQRFSSLPVSSRDYDALVMRELRKRKKDYLVPSRLIQLSSAVAPRYIDDTGWYGCI